MIEFEQEDERLVISSPRFKWEATQDSRHGMNAPTSLVLAGTPAAQWFCELGDTPDEMALLESLRPHQRRSGYLVECKGRLPYGMGVPLTHNVHYGAMNLRTTSDITIFPETTLIGQLGIGCAKLDDRWTQYHLLEVDEQGNCRLTPPAPIPKPPGLIANWGTPPLAPPPLSLILIDEQENKLELGMGNDLWRWDAGIGGETNRLEHRLERNDQGQLFFRRRVSIAENSTAELRPDPRTYRFSWYAAWTREQSEDPVMPPVTDIPHLPCVIWKKSGSIYQIPETGDAPLLIDFQHANWPDSLRCCPPRSAAVSAEPAAPCLVSAAVMRRLKKTIRQIKARTHPKQPLIFTGLSPQVCTAAHHTQRKGQRRHWDLSSLLEFGHWTRFTLGSGRPLFFVHPAFTTPALQNIFTMEEKDSDAFDEF